jgi:lipopolysaccharide transport system ATP-binding protein
MIGRADDRPRYEDFWALRDVSFDVRRGDCVGVIGRNGAGKSTLLKLLSRITEPTEGGFRMCGRVASLLEVGTGFHPELTGSENVYLNGAILGMSRAEIRRKFDEIVAFAEVEKFLETPVKYYSSGMYVRLAFAVAAHLDPEILVVDEVLAVGDTGFQKKCLGKMGEAARCGRTVLFVSHQLDAMERFCTRAILLKSGRMMLDGLPSHVISHYTASEKGMICEKEWGDDGPGTAESRLRAVRICNERGECISTIDTETRFGVEMTYDVLVPGLTITPNIHFFDRNGLCLFIAIENDERWCRSPRPEGRYTSTVWIPPHLLGEGELWINVALTRLEPQKIFFHEKDVLAINVSDVLESPTRGGYGGRMPGVIRPLLDWSTTQTSRTSY